VHVNHPVTAKNYFCKSKKETFSHPWIEKCLSTHNSQASSLRLSWSAKKLRIYLSNIFECSRHTFCLSLSLLFLARSTFALHNFVAASFQHKRQCTRGGRSHIFRLWLRSCSKIFEPRTRSEIFSNLRIRLGFRLRLPSIQPKYSSDSTLRNDIYKEHADSCYWRKWQETPVRVWFFTNFWLPPLIQKKNAGSFRSRLRHSGLVATSAIYI